MTCNPKIVVFDLDETLGYFTELGIFWDSLENYTKEPLICALFQVIFVTLYHNLRVLQST